MSNGLFIATMTVAFLSFSCTNDGTSTNDPSRDNIGLEVDDGGIPNVDLADNGTSMDGDDLWGSGDDGIESSEAAPVPDEAPGAAAAEPEGNFEDGADDNAPENVGHGIDEEDGASPDENAGADADEGMNEDFASPMGPSSGEPMTDEVAPDSVALCQAFAAAVCARGRECVENNPSLVDRLAYCNQDCTGLNDEERVGFSEHTDQLELCIESIATAECDGDADPDGFLFNAIIETDACRAWAENQ